MKFTTVMTVLALALACATTGCRYDKAQKETAGTAGDGSIEASNIATDGDMSGSLDSIGENKFEDMFEKCTDVDFTPVYFGFDSTVVPQGELGKVETVAQHLQSNPTRVVVIEGHCDERGSNEYNLSLGESRAQIVQNYLVQNGIAANRIQTRSFGEEKPANSGHDEGAWAQNRRGEFGIYDSAKRK